MTILVRILRLATILGVLIWPMAAHSAPCAGFTDVDDASGFCKNVEWLKNRLITLGCTSATLYCPTDTVTRNTMAAFLNRLGNALTPIDVRVTTSGGAVDLESSPIVCTTTPVAIANAPRLAHGEVAFLAASDASSADFLVRIEESTDGGATWNPASQYQIGTTAGGLNREIATVMLGPRILEVGTSYSWALRLNRLGTSTTTGDLGGWQCHLRVTLENRNSAVSPLDVDD